jgi:hypothetical protein
LIEGEEGVLQPWLRLWLLLAATASYALFAQSNTSGDIFGSVTDLAGATVPNASVVAQSAASGFQQATTTSNNGTFRIPLLPAGSYDVTVAAAGFQTVKTRATVTIGGAAQTTTTLLVRTKTTSIEVLAERPFDRTGNGNTQTIFDATAIQNLPNPGGDITFYAQLAPGAVMNTNGGYGNFSVFGLPGTSNLFTLNSQNDNDPFLNVNKSGATNLLLGANELAEVSVTVNGYSAQYGQLAGANVNYVTKSGTNTLHGNASYYWDGRIMNANDFFNNANGIPRQFVNANQWAASVGGPIKKNKTFFFVNNEGLRVVLPTVTSPVRLPSLPFQDATLMNLSNTGLGTEVPFYRQLFKAFNSATGVSRASAEPQAANDLQGHGCGDLTILAPGVPCIVGYSAAPNAFAREWQLAVRVDQTFGGNDRIYARFQTDRGVGPTYTDPINPVFSAISHQPENQGQFGWTHILSPRATNQFIGSGLYSNVPFGPENPAVTNALLPYYFGMNDGSLSSLNATETFTPQGREFTQFQIVDDLSYTAGGHTLKAGLNYHRVLLDDYDFGINTGGELVFGSIDNLYNGMLGDYGFFAQNFPAKLEQDIRTYQLGFYFEDDVRIDSRLNLTLSLRADHSSNPTCLANCFTSSVAPFTELNHDPAIPYDAVIRTAGRKAYPAYDNILWEPRLGFAYSPSSGKTALRGGIGLFGDSFPAGGVDGFAENIPRYNSIALVGTAGYSATPVASGVSGSVFDIASSASQSLNSAFGSGGTLASISASNPLFSAPNLTTSDSKVHQPRYYEWNLEFDQQLPWSVTLSVGYVGNRGTREMIANSGLNGFCSACAASFTAFPSVPADPRFFQVTQYQSSGVSRYNGLVVSARKTLNEHAQFNFNYSYSHALDDVSNGGLAGFAGNSILAPVDPFNIRAYNWGNSDYDVKHYLSASYVLKDVVRGAGFHHGSDLLFGGWTVSGTVFHRTGFPFSVTDSATNLVADGGPALAYSTTSGRPACSARAVYTNGTPCLTLGEFSPVVDPLSGLMLGLGNQSRNQYRGPGYFNTDLNVLKSFRIRERLRLSLGAQFFNLFNHPNFAPPVSNRESSFFGQITSAVSVPTSMLGSLLGGDASPRLIQLHSEVRF